MKTFHPKIAIASLSLALVCNCSPVCAAEQAETKRDTSPPLTDTARQMQERERARAGQEAFIERKEHRVKSIPLPPKKNAPAPALKAPAVAPKKLDATIGVEFPGIGGENYVIKNAPPDTNGTVGEDYYVQWVNEAFAVFDKRTKGVKVPPTDGSALWTGFGGNCEHSNDGDPITLYDKAAKRWFMTQFAVSNGPPYSQCIAISKTADPTGEYFRYEFQFSDFNDYPKFGVWPDGYYGTFNMFKGNAFIGAKVCAFDRAKMLAGDSATMQCFDVPDQGGLLPSDLDGTTAPPAGSPNYVVNFGDNEINLWKFNVDWVTPANSKLTGPSATQVAAFSPACANGDCISQPGTTQKLQPMSDRLMYRLAYRNMGPHEVLVVNHTVSTGSGSGIRWYELRNPQGTLEVKQQGTFAPDSQFRWLASIATDKMGNILMGYSVSGPKLYPSIRYTGRAVADPPGVMAIEEKLFVGKGAQNKDLDRWGDYSSISIDPSDDCTFWFTTQYLPKSGSFNWSTRIASVKFPNCTSP